MPLGWRTTCVVAVLPRIGLCLVQEAVTPALGQELSAKTKAALKERDKLQAQARQVHIGRKFAEAIAIVEVMLAIERQVLSAGHDDVINSLGWLTELDPLDHRSGDCLASTCTSMSAARAQSG